MSDAARWQEWWGYVRAVKPAHRAWLMQQGVPDRLARHGWIGVARAAFDETIWQPDDRGRLVWVVPVLEGIRDPVDLDRAASRVVLSDIVAFRAGEPGRVWRRWGDATWFNPDEVDLALHGGAPLTVFRSPWSWMMAGAPPFGVAPLDLVPALQDLLVIGGDFTAEDEVLARDLAERLQALAFARLPTIVVSEAA